MKINKERAAHARSMAKSRQQMAEILGIHIGSISRILKRYELPGFRRPPIGEVEARAAREKAASLNEMALELSCCALAARQAIKKYGLESYGKKSYGLPVPAQSQTPPEDAPPIRRVPITDEMRDKYALKKKAHDASVAQLRKRARRNKLLFLGGMILIGSIVLTGILVYGNLVYGG